MSSNPATVTDTLPTGFFDTHLGQADPALFDHHAWRDCARRAWGTRDFAELAADQYGVDDALLIIAPPAREPHLRK